MIEKSPQSNKRVSDVAKDARKASEIIEKSPQSNNRISGQSAPFTKKKQSTKGNDGTNESHVSKSIIEHIQDQNDLNEDSIGGLDENATLENAEKEDIVVNQP